ncbi:ROK family protein [Clostridium frigidicarnis]|uniref:Sugar kinase of the NBD/HSP70 family, may contain an N-terminal HTH domain n=1 Tax=Clostridium frigidicarnis TaxID=84698 RepID=A0A1I0Y650_9CLOT|nr:ROK family protein [Clostridium frigidicarnis]SFB08761.1 Sugar kinase of the NBD/HSP70 family, may contain an N-terminal HTH domain [Clostridium frigidicarnis]
MNKYLCFDIGGTKVKYGVLLEDGQAVLLNSYNTETKDKERFFMSIIDLIEEHKIKNNISGVSLCIPGIVNAYKGQVSLCYALRFLEGMSIKEFLENKCKLRIEIENDANCVALAEKFTGNGKECSDFVCMIIGTGIGGGIFANGSMIRGSRFMGGEFGFMITEGMNMHNEGMEIISDGGSTKGLINMYKKLKNIDSKVNIEGEIIFNEGNNDVEVKKIIDIWYRRIAYGIFNLAGTLNPEKILIGGGVSAREDFIENIEFHLKKIKWWEDIKVKIEPCYHKNNSGTIGSLYNFLTIRK